MLVISGLKGLDEEAWEEAGGLEISGLGCLEVEALELIGDLEVPWEVSCWEIGLEGGGLAAAALDVVWIYLGATI